MEGRVLAERFRIGELLGAGAFGEVWVAQDERMRRDVAVKFVYTVPTREAATQARFQREVQLAGRLSHRNIVTVHDWGEAQLGGRQAFFLVMELVRGVTMARRLNEGIPPWPLAVGWAAQIAEALDDAHSRGVIHRDIKPANVLLTPEGTAKVLDFGIAKFMGDTLSVHDLTATGAQLGTPEYMSPEQVEGVREIDHRTDLYSLGCLLYHAVTGRPPFVAGNQWAVTRMQMDDLPAPPRTLAEGLPEPLNDLILSLLAKRPEDRPADAAAVHDALSTLLLEESVALSGGTVLETAQLSRADSLAGRILGKAWELRQRTEAQNAARRAEAEAEAAKMLRRARAEAERLLDEAATEIETRFAEVDRLAQGTLDKAAEKAAAITRAAADEAERVRKEAAAEAGRLRADAVAEALTARSAPALGRAASTRPGPSIADFTVPDFVRPEFPGFELARRGYHRDQVDERLAKLVSDRDSALARVAELERHVVQKAGGAWLGASAQGLIADAYRRAERQLFARQIRGAPRPESFELVSRGYDCAQVDQRVAALVTERHLARVSIGALEDLIKEKDLDEQRRRG
ncbi:protein kinase [Streptomyces sp. NPDC001480]|uniref:serine/threonine-protein kinase n=1 Tax=Streptomyces sp. NPDC001480 TaxID=3364577 RepID=UPI0036BD69EA